MSATACPVCGGTVERSRQGRPALYCGKRCRQAAYRARLAAERAADYARWLRGQMLQLRGELAEASDDVLSVLGGLPVPDRHAVPAWWTEDVAAYADRTRRLASRAFDLAAAYRKAAAVFEAARAVFGRVEASTPVGDESGTSVADGAAPAT